MEKKELPKLQKSMLETLWFWEHRNVIPFPEKSGDRKRINELIIRRFFDVSQSAMITSPMRASVSRSQKTLRRSGLIERSRYGIKLTQAGRNMARALSNPKLEKFKAINWPSGWTLHRADPGESNRTSIELEIRDQGAAIGRFIFY